jgi:hypothetical protein
MWGSVGDLQCDVVILHIADVETIWTIELNVRTYLERRARRCVLSDGMVASKGPHTSEELKTSLVKTTCESRLTKGLSVGGIQSGRAFLWNCKQ